MTATASATKAPKGIASEPTVVTGQAAASGSGLPCGKSWPVAEVSRQ